VQKLVFYFALSLFVILLLGSVESQKNRDKGEDKGKGKAKGSWLTKLLEGCECEKKVDPVCIEFKEGK